MVKNKRSILILIALMAILCLMFVAFGDKKSDDSADDESAAVTEEAQDQTEEVSEPEEPAAEEAAEVESGDEESEEVQGAEKQAKEDTSDKDNSKKDTPKKKTPKKKKAKKQSSENSDNSSSGSQPKQKKKVWVPPVTETRTVTLETGTRYCCGANSNGGCGASWHGTKSGTYSEWKSHWQAYVKKRTEEEAAKGKTYVCDHVHDDSYFVPDTTTEEVVIQEGYWKEVDE